MKTIALLLAAFLPLPAQASPSIAEKRKVSIGGVEQNLLIRGDDRSNPIILFLHGGPGVSEMPLAYKNRALEHDFVVVEWDQRSTGKSFRPDTPALRIDQFVADTLELTRLLEHEFKQSKIILAGHSWGSFVGVIAVARAPALFRAYVGVSQFVNIPQSERDLDNRSRGAARAQSDTRALAKLEKLGRYPYPSHKIERQVNKVQKQIMGEVPNELSAARFLAIGLASPDYNWADDIKLLRGIPLSGRALERAIYAANLFTAAPRIDLPVWFFAGRHDAVLSQIVARRYFEKLIAPRGKHFVWFEQSNHWPQLEETEKYQAALREVKKETETKE